MKLPAEFINTQEWTVVGPMGPPPPDFLLSHPILAVDAGADFCQKMDIWVGDGDSIKKPIEAANIFKFSPQKSESDLAIALSLLGQHHHRTLHLWGFLGGRKDHEWLNMGEVMRYLQLKPKSEVIFYDSKTARPTVRCLGAGDWVIEHKGIFSVASTQRVRAKILGDCDYPLTEFTEFSPLSSLGLSNSSQGKFQIINDGALMVIFPELN